MFPMLLLANQELTKANDLYASKKYKQALELYSSLRDSSAHSSHLLYNIANCHAKMDNLGLAILFYEKALKYNPNLLEAKQNLILEEEKVNDDLGLKPRTSTLNKIARSPRGNFWNYLAVFCALLGGLFFFLAFKKKKGTLHFLGFGFVILCATFMIFSYVQYDSWSQSKNGIVLQGTNLKKGQDAESDDSYFVPEGIKLEIVSIDDDWIQVEVRKEKLWIPKTYFKEI